MMANLQGFDANTVTPMEDFKLIPTGEYLAAITDSEMKLTKAGNGQYLALTFQIIEGDYKERQLWVRLNLDNPNEMAVKIARGELSSICRAVGVMAPNDSVELHNLPLVITVKCRKREDNGELTNEIKGYVKQEPGSSQPPQGKPGDAPWKRS